jgi:hypothetical protein
LHLLVHARRNHVFLDHQAASSAFVARLDRAVGRTRPFTRLANVLLLNIKLNIPPHVEITQWELKLDFHIRAPAMPTTVSKMSAAAEKARKQVKRIAAATTTTTSPEFLLL